MSNQTAKSESVTFKRKNSFLEYFTNLKAIVNMETSEEDDIFINVKKAQQEFEKAQLYFESVTEPDLVDHAIYNLEAAKTKYYYLLKKARKVKKNMEI